MNIWQTYTSYLKDNPEGYWFKRKLYGWGWTPATKAGWLVTIVFLVSAIGVALVRENYPQLISDVDMALVLLGLVCLFLAIAYKTGEPPRWQWGQHEK